jgi:hypothetical protein
MKEEPVKIITKDDEEKNIPEEEKKEKKTKSKIRHEKDREANWY